MLEWFKRLVGLPVTHDEVSHAVTAALESVAHIKAAGNVLRRIEQSDDLMRDLVYGMKNAGQRRIPDNEHP